MQEAKPTFPPLSEYFSRPTRIIFFVIALSFREAVLQDVYALRSVNINRCKQSLEHPPISAQDIILEAIATEGSHGDGKQCQCYCKFSLAR